MLNHNLSLHPSKCSSTMTCFKVNENTVLFLHYQFPLAVWMYIPKSRWIGWTKIIGNDFHQKDLRKWKPNIETARLVQNNLKFSHNKYQINFLQWQKKSKWFPRTIKYICTQCNFPFSIFLQRPKRNPYVVNTTLPKSIQNYWNLPRTKLYTSNMSFESYWNTTYKCYADTWVVNVYITIIYLPMY